MTFRFRFVFLATTAALAFPVGLATDSALAADVRSFKAKTKAVEIAILVDRSILAEPKLGRAVRAEAARDMARWKREAAVEYRQVREFFRDGRTWSFEKIRSEVFRSEGHLSVLSTLSTYTGGAHGNVAFTAVTWDRKRGKAVAIGDVFAEVDKDGPALTALIGSLRRVVAAERKERGASDESDPATLAPALPADPQDLPPFTLEPSTETGKAAGLTFHIAPYRVGSYAEGTYEAFVPWRDFAAHLRPEWRDLFGGAKKPG